MIDPSEFDTTQLLNKARNGDTEAYGELYERYAPRVFRYLYAHLNNRQDAEDLTEEVFIRVWRSIASYKEQGVPYLAYLFRVARNALIDHYRKNASTKQEVSIADISLQDRTQGPGDAVAAMLEHEQLRQKMGKLREDYRTVLILRFLSELSPEETAQVMGRSAGAVRVLQHRALAALRELMGET
ncbi:MAG TPA: RNA polymerase sigma factor [Anaerolineales bacterium]|nr:RNA polymerase sigma factor [Anaerolineales bacterium]